MKKQKWIWEYDEYPNFKYDKEKIEPLLRDIAYEQGKLKSFMLLMDKESTRYSLAQTLENEIIASCEIEGEILNPVAYTHLTLPTIPLVTFSWVAVVFSKYDLGGGDL